MKYLLPLCALSLSCTGILDGEQPGPKGSATAMNPDGTPAAGGAPSQMSKADPFSVRVGVPELLPFDVRVRRIANTLQVQTSNPMFSDMMAKNVQLGDYDHAAGALPDNLWLARRLSSWANALKPVCSSPEMRAMFPALPENAPQLIKAAWGRAAAAEEVTEMTSAVQEAALPDAALAYEATCMAVFSAAEFVFR